MSTRIPQVCAALAALAITHTVARDAEPCGGCFVPPVESTQVTGHRMLLSVSQQASTLVDQIEYSGDPESFAWVLPIRAPVQVGVSSDLVFQLLDSGTQVRITAEPLNCPPPRFCPDDEGITTTTLTSTTTTGVTVIAEEVVGPYETVQLAATDPGALDAWLDGHGYTVPNEVQPIIDSYLAEGFDFLAIKLVPGEGVSAMRPIRVTTPGAGLALPLRMVAAGTGETTTITLWVLAEGRYEPQNFPWFLIGESDLVWDWSAGQSNYRDLRQAGYDAEDGYAWLVETARVGLESQLSSSIMQAAELMPETSGYDPDNAVAEAGEDLDVLLGQLPGGVMVTRLRAELSRPALAEDLLLQAASDQSELPLELIAAQSINKPTCPSQEPCPDEDEEGMMGGPFGDTEDDSIFPSRGDCACTQPGARSGSAALSLLAMLVAAAFSWRRRRAPWR